VSKRNAVHSVQIYLTPFAESGKRCRKFTTGEVLWAWALIATFYSTGGFDSLGKARAKEAEEFIKGMESRI
jgi:hypothetical protein